jgi:hypothetical protein
MDPITSRPSNAQVRALTVGFNDLGFGLHRLLP